MTLQLKLLGAPSLSNGAEEVHLRRKRAIALLAYMSVTQTCHRREALAALFWPESAPSRSLSALRNLLWMIRQTPAAAALDADRSSVRVDTDDALRVDVNEFRLLSRTCPEHRHSLETACEACVPSLQRALALWKGEFLAGYTIDGSAEFDDWQLAEGHALRQEYGELLSRLIRHSADREDWAAVLEYGRIAVRHDPLNELAYRALMKAHAESGHRSDALGVYDTCVSSLEEALGVAPAEETVRLAEALRASGSLARSQPAQPNLLLLTRAKPLIGREHEVRRIKRLISSGEERVVAVVGLGGIGKTTVALRAAEALAPTFADGIVMLSVDRLRPDTSVASALASSLGAAVGCVLTDSHADRVGSILRDRAVLIILDAVEDHAEEVEQLVPVLLPLSNASVILTSRKTLGGLGTCLTLGGLRVPVAGDPPEEAEGTEAVRLLRLTAKRSGVEEPVADMETKVVARLARTLEGSPLALEMAAGWRRHYSWAEIDDRVSESVRFLVPNPRGGRLGHETLAAVFEHSWEGLSENARQALASLSVLSGPFTMVAAEDIAGAGPSVLASLVNRFLLVPSDERMFRMHGLVRGFASEKLSVEGREQAILRQVHHYAKATEEWLIPLRGAGQHEVLHKIERELRGMDSAFYEAAARGLSEPLSILAEGLWIYYLARTDVIEGEEVFAAAFDAYTKVPNADRQIAGFIRIACGFFSNWARAASAHDRIDEGLALTETSEPLTRLRALGYMIYSSVSYRTPREENEGRLRDALRFFRDEGDDSGEAWILGGLADLEFRAGNLASAKTLAEECLLLRRRIGDQWGEGLIIFRLAQISEAEGKYELAFSQYLEAKRLNGPFAGNFFGAISVTLALARMSGQLGDRERRLELAREALKESRRTGYRYQIGRSLLESAKASHALCDPETAALSLAEAFRVLADRPWLRLQSECAELLVRIEAERGRTAEAARWQQELEIVNRQMEDEAAARAD